MCHLKNSSEEVMGGKGKKLHSHGSLSFHVMSCANGVNGTLGWMDLGTSNPQAKEKCQCLVTP